MSYKGINNKGYVFALDIGTRSIIGILGRKDKDKIIVEHIEERLHKKRVMYKGQIHDIDGVAQVVEDVKLALEEKAGCQLDEVTIAVAGRSLQTNRVSISRELDITKNIDMDLINSLEVEGLQESKNQLERQSEEYMKYFCVGHTVIHYYIDDVIITNPLGHKGNKIRIDLLATFLPQMVVDSLYAVTSKLNLEVKYMTLEPIAAIEVAVPENARLLNLALVDIGAGTSDIAITRDGTVVAYGMTSSAGDDITEQIAKQYLMDFDAAEELKINLNKDRIQRFSDIVGLAYEVESKEILKEVEATIRKVASLIANNIVEQNGRSPSAVFLIGGGGQVPYLSRFIAEELGLPEERVVVRGIEAFKDTIISSTPISGPEYITPVGILAKTLKNRELDFIEIFVNDQRFRLFQTRKLQVKDALVLAGFNPRKLIPERGKSINITINNKRKTLYGEYGEPAKILINDQACSIESNIRDGDIIRVYPAEKGEEKTYQLRDILPLENKIYINDNPTLQVYDYTVNKQLATKDTIIQDGDYIEYRNIASVRELCHYMDLDYGDYHIEVNNIEAGLEDSIGNGDYINIEKRKAKEKGYGNIGSEGREALTGEKIIVKCNGQVVEIPDKKNGVIFVDIFDYIDFDRSRVQGKLVLLLNGRVANYTDIIRNGDEIEVYWDK